ncbi:MAG: hypothetical protein ACRDYA_12510 [Egibacteraceae bacterium]
MFEDRSRLDPFEFRADFLGKVREVCRLHLAKDPATNDAEIEERKGDGRHVDYLLVREIRRLDADTPILHG